MAITADELITGVKRRVTVPASQPLLAPTDILSLADDVMRSKMVPLHKSVNQNYFVVKELVPIVNGTKDYQLPYRAIGRTLRDVKMVDPGGNRFDMSLMALEDEHYATETTGIPRSYFFFGDKLSLVPTPGVDNYSLQVWYEFQPGRFIQSSSCGKITAKTSTTVTVASLPSTITSSTLIDFIQYKQGSITLGYDVSIVSVVGNVLTFASSDIPSSLAVGDYISPAGYSPVVQIPDESYPLLETTTCMRVLGAIGDFEGKQDLMNDFKEEERNLLRLIEPRVEGEQTKIVNRRGFVWSRRGRFGLTPGRLL